MSFIALVAPDPVATITTATADLGTQVLTVGAIGLGVGVAVFVLRKGWRLLKGFTS